MTDVRPSRHRDDDALPSAPGAFRRFVDERPRLVDVTVSVAYLAIDVFGILSSWLATGVAAPTLLPLVLLAFVSAGAHLARRRRPRLVFLIVLATTVAGFIITGALSPIALVFALYALGVHGSSRDAWLGFALATAVAVLAPVAGVVVGDRWSVNVLFVLVLLVATLSGVAAGDRRRYVAALRERARQLARERDQQARIAAVAERNRIAREMHDVVAHSLSVMVSLADGADAQSERDPARAADAMREVSGIGRRSLSEMRRLLGVLDAGDDAAAPLLPQPGFSDLDALLDTFRAAGLPVRIEVSGTPPTSAGVQAAVHRIVQEALTNCLRYAEHPSDVSVRVSFDGMRGVIDVTDDGRDSTTPRPSAGSGRGLLGIRERAALYGGTLETGPRDGGGWRVLVTLPQAGEDA